MPSFQHSATFSAGHWWAACFCNRLVSSFNFNRHSKILIASKFPFKKANLYDKKNIEPTVQTQNIIKNFHRTSHTIRLALPFSKYTACLYKFPPNNLGVGMLAIDLPRTWFDGDKILKKEFLRLFKAKEIKHTVFFQAWHNPGLAEFAKSLAFSLNKWKSTHGSHILPKSFIKTDAWEAINLCWLHWLLDLPHLKFLWLATALISSHFLFILSVEQENNYPCTSFFSKSYVELRFL